MRIKFIKFIFYLLSIVSKILNFLVILLTKIISKFVFLGQGNFYNKNFSTEYYFIKDHIYNNMTIKAKVNNFWDFWRLHNFETYPIDEIIKDRHLFEKKQKKIVYYEIGANVGLSALFISKALENNGKIYAFEIEPANFKAMNDNFLINKFKNYNLINLGISNENKIKKFYYNISHKNNNHNLPVSSMGMHSMKFNEKIHDKNIYSNLIFMKFENIIDDFNLDYPTHLFIDAYGAENEIINSIFSTKKKQMLPYKIMVDIEEIGISNVENSHIYKILKQNNYKLKKYFFEKGEGNIPDSYKAIFEINE